LNRKGTKDAKVMDDQTLEMQSLDILMIDRHIICDHNLQKRMQEMSTM